MQGDSIAGGTNTESLTLNGCTDPSGFSFCSVYTAGGGTLYVPGGMIGDSHGVVYCGILLFPTGCQTSNKNYWYVQDPPGIPLACVPNIGSGSCYDTRGNDLVGATTGAGGGILLTSPSPQGDPTCSPGGSNTQTSAGCWAADYQIVSQAQATNPPCLTGVTECLKWTQSANMTVTAALSSASSWCNTKLCNHNNATQVKAAIGPNYGCASCYSDVVQSSGAVWYLYRLITDIVLSFQAPLIEPQCSGDCTSATLGVSPDNGQLTNVVNNQFLPEINKAAVISGARIVFGLSVSGLAPQCPSPVNPSNCWFGITGMWLGAQGLQTSGCPSTVAGCSITNANILHYQFPLYQDPALTQPAAVPSAQDVITLASLTNSTIQQIQQSSVFGNVYSYIDAGAIGTQYTTPSGGCMVGSLSSCINAPTPVFINVPLIYDVIGSYTNFWYTYPGIPPVGGANAGSFAGHVYGAGTLLGIGNSPIAGACIGLGGPCSGYSGQIQTQSGGDGSYTLANVPPGTYQLSASANGFVGQSVFGIKITAGAITAQDFTLNPINPPGQTCLIQPSYSPLPPYQQTFGGLCAPTWAFFATIGLVGLALAAVVVASPAGRAAGTVFGAVVPRRRQG